MTRDTHRRLAAACAAGTVHPRNQSPLLAPVSRSIASQA
ncbi:hypothetical protein F8B43_0582 [Methylorubrum populi]|uniref:Uncharacterized protein n=1 Tax=Methylorubrum populi TaxID=223967 RepID=A0A833J913_9HYPH|nr:hypothetical protein F8B43_0582 [Methylorubrum populi]